MRCESQPERIGVPVICTQSDGMGSSWVLLTTGEHFGCGYDRGSAVRVLDHDEQITLTQVIEAKN